MPHIEPFWICTVCTEMTLESVSLWECHLCKAHRPGFRPAEEGPAPDDIAGHVRGVTRRMQLRRAELEQQVNDAVAMKSSAEIGIVEIELCLRELATIPLPE